MRAARRRGPGADRCGLHGRIESFPLAELVQTLHLSGRTCEIRIEGPGEDGAVWLADGATVHATAPGREGEEAFHEILRWGQGDFHVEDAAEAPRRTIASDTMFLLLEALRRIDESTEAHPTETDAAAPEPPSGRSGTSTRRGRIVGALLVVLAACTGLAWMTSDPASRARDIGGEAAVTSVVAPIPLARSTPDGRAPAPGVPLETAPSPPVARPAVERSRPPAVADPDGTGSAPDRLIGPDPRLARDPAPLLAGLLPGPYVGPIRVQAAPAPSLGSLAFDVVSRVPAGRLVVEIDDRLALEREVRWDPGTGKRIFKRIAGTDGDRFAERFTLEAGEHAVVARLIDESGGTVHELRVALAVDRDAERSYGLVASRKNGGTLTIRERHRDGGNP